MVPTCYQTGSDADIVVFDPATVIDRSSFENPKQPSAGMRYVLVGGKLVVEDGKINPERFARSGDRWVKKSLG